MKTGAVTAWLFTTTSPARIFGGYASIQPDRDLLIAVDAGLGRIHELGLTPSLIIGDLDSVDHDLLRLYPEVELIRHPREKNETDTELAMLWCIDRGVKNVVICNSLQGRFDHGLALVQNLALLRSEAIAARVESANQMLWFLEAETHLKGREGCLLSLLAWGGEARFAGSEGLQYSLQGVRLQPWQARGISNRVVGAEASIRLASGDILAILTKCDETFKQHAK